MLRAAKSRIFLFSCLLFGLLLFFSSPSFAQSSTNYRIGTDVISGGGGESASTNYRSHSTLGQSSPLGPSNNSEYHNYPGFIYCLEGIPLNFQWADFNGDGQSDILWRNTSNGMNAVWFMDGTTVTGFAVLDSMTDQNWEIVGR